MEVLVTESPSIEITWDDGSVKNPQPTLKVVYILEQVKSYRAECQLTIL